MLPTKPKNINFNENFYKVLTDDEYQELLKSNKIFIKAFFNIFNFKLFKFEPLLIKAFYKKSEQQKVKIYIDFLAKARKMKESFLTNEEKAIDWQLTHQFIKSDDNIKISCYFIKSWVANNNNNKWFVICHGLNSNKLKSTIYGLIYLRLGYNIAVFDFRNHGKSGKSITTMGYYEYLDIKAIVDYLNQNYNNPEVNFHGWSMGTMALSRYLEINYSYKQNKYVIMDSPIDKMTNLWKFYIETKFKNSFFDKFDLLKRYCKDNYHYNIENFNLDESIESLNKLAILFILYKKDNITPCELGDRLYKNKIINEDNQIISDVIALNYNHASGIYNDYSNYKSIIIKYLNNKDKNDK